MLYNKISIITPSLNQGRFIEETIQSVLDQKYPNLEYIIMDGGSRDNTLDIIKKYSNHLTWFSEKDNGQSHAINKGFNIASGNILAWLCSDDIYLPQSLFKVNELFNNNINYNWLIGSANVINSISIKYNILNTSLINDLNCFDDWGKYCFPQSSVFWKTDLWNKVILNENYHYIMDIDLWYQMYKIESPLITNEFLSSLRHHNQSKTCGNNQRNLQIEYNYWKKYKN